ncbi:MAG: VTT domain-containing protein [Candidatus Omnitrophica bacterium]|nr:VTT domain-containing protein [Candidatus Omnitrophota bacterium]
MDPKIRRYAARFVALLVFVLLVWRLGKYFPVGAGGIQDYLARFPKLYSGLLYILLYVIITFFVWFSKDVFWVVGAVLFGAFFSALYVWIAEIINAVILFYLARSLGRKFVEYYARARFGDLDKKIGCLNFSWFFLLRAIPIVPYRFIDLVAGLTCISFGRYMAAVILGSGVKIFWIQYILAQVGVVIFRDPYVVVEYFLNNRALFYLSLIYLLLVIVVTVKFRVKLKR